MSAVDDAPKFVAKNVALGVQVDAAFSPVSGVMLFPARGRWPEFEALELIRGAVRHLLESPDGLCAVHLTESGWSIARVSAWPAAQVS